MQGFKHIDTKRRNYIKTYKLLGFIAILFLSIGAVNAGTIEGYFMPGGMYGGHSGYYEWVDYCPQCGHHNCLMVNPKGTVEGEITCSVCDSDYDGCTGADKHADGAWAWLTRYYEPEPEPVIEQPIIQTPPPPTNTVIESELGTITVENKHLELLKTKII